MASGLKRQGSQREGQVCPCSSGGSRTGLSGTHCQSSLWVLPVLCRASGAAPQRPHFLSLAQMASAGREPGPAGLLLGIS